MIDKKHKGYWKGKPLSEEHKMKKQMIYLMLAVLSVTLLELSFVSASSMSYMPINMPNNEKWQQWEVTKTTDKNFSIKIENPRFKSTEICLLSDIATREGDIPATKVLYGIDGRQIKTLPVISKSTATIQTKYGYCYTTIKETYLKFGENSTTVEWVNETGGYAYKGYNFIAGSLADGSPINNPGTFPIYLTYTADEKNTVSVDNSTVVTGSGSGLGGTNCRLKTGRYGSSAGCFTLIVSDCPNYFFYTESIGVTCSWIPSPGICVTSQPCTRYAIHNYYFNITKAGATNLTITMKMKTDTPTPPSATVTINYYMTNQTNGAPMNLGFTSQAGTSIWHNFTYSTTNINDYINNLGEVRIYAVTGAVQSISARYTEAKVDYRDLTIRYKTFTSMLAQLKYRNPNLPLTIRWRTS